MGKGAEGSVRDTMVRHDAIVFARFRRCGATVLSCLALLFILLVTTPSQAKYASIVIDGHSGEVLHETNADTRNYPASLTKMMTLYMLFEALDQGKVTKSSRFQVSHRAARQSPSKLGLRPGQSITVDDAIKALAVKSANDVAVVVAEALAGSETNFARAMTRKAHQIGMTKTTFANASGLPNRKQLSTARDMARLAQSLYFTFPHHYHYFGIERFRYAGRSYRTHNRVLNRYQGADGLKTGYIRASGYNLVTSVERNGRRLIGVVFGGKSSRSRDNHMIALLDRSWPKLRVADIPAPRPKPAGLGALAQLAPPPVTISPPTQTSTPLADIAVAQKPVPPGMEPAPKPEDLATTPPPSQFTPTGDWAVQVGAYYDRGKAQAAIERATAKVPSLDGRTEEAIVLLKGRKKPIYRARLVGLSLKEAQAACRELKRKKIACLPVKHPYDAVVASIE